MSRRVGADAQGELQGVVASTISLATILAPLVMTQVFFLTTRGGPLHHPGAAFLLAAVLMSFGVLTYLTGRRPRAS